MSVSRIVILFLVVIFTFPPHAFAVSVSQADAHLGWTKTGAFDISTINVGDVVSVTTSFQQTSCVKPVRGDQRRIMGFRLAAAGGNDKGSALDFSAGTFTVKRNGEVLKGKTLGSDRSIFAVAESIFKFDEPIRLTDSDRMEFILSNVKVKLAAQATLRISSLSEASDLEKKWAKDEGRDIWYIEGFCPGASSVPVTFITKTQKKEQKNTSEQVHKPTLKPTSTPTSTPVLTVSSTPTPTPAGMEFLRPKQARSELSSVYWRWSDALMEKIVSTSASGTPAGIFRGFRAVWESVFR